MAFAGHNALALALQILRGHWFMIFASLVLMSTNGSGYIYAIYSTPKTSPLSSTTSKPSTPPASSKTSAPTSASSPASSMRSPLLRSSLSSAQPWTCLDTWWSISLWPTASHCLIYGRCASTSPLGPIRSHSGIQHRLWPASRTSLRAEGCWSGYLKASLASLELRPGCRALSASSSFGRWGSSRMGWGSWK